MKKKIFCYIVIMFFIYNGQKKNVQSKYVTTGSYNERENLHQSAINLVPTPPKIKNNINWKNKLLPIIKNMLLTSIKEKYETNDQKLFIYTISKNENFLTETYQITYALINLLNDLKSHFLIINGNKSNKIFENIKFSNNNLTPCSKSIKLARYVNAQYALCNTINHDLKEKNLNMQLILVRTGIIIWSNTISI